MLYRMIYWTAEREPHTITFAYDSDAGAVAWAERLVASMQRANIPARLTHVVIHHKQPPVQTMRQPRLV